MTLTFAHRKATQALNFFARKAGGWINTMKALKLVFFADRYHLRQYGRPITNDEYLAMEYGPVPSGCKDLAEMSDFLDPHERRYAEQFLHQLAFSPVCRLVKEIHEGKYAEQFLQRTSQYGFASVADVEAVVFSKTDLEALEFAWHHFGQMDQFRLAEITHEYPEWKRHQTALQSPDVSRIGMSYRHFLDDPPAGVDPGPKLSAHDRRLREEELEELHTIESLWA